MADAGKDLLLTILEKLEKIEGKIDRLDTRLNNTNDTMSLIGGVVHRAVATVAPRIDSLDARVTALENER